MSKNKINASFSITDSIAMKGIAIILMVFHHSFFRADLTWDYAIIFYPFSHDFVVRMALVCKICVSIFAFLSGYGLYISFRSKPEDHPVKQWTLKRLLSTMSGFWFVYILVFLATQLYASMPQIRYAYENSAVPVALAVIDFFGLSSLFGTPSLDGAWWYMSAAIIFILLIPAISKFDDIFGKCTLIILSAALVRYISGGYPGGNSPYSFLLSVIFGVLFAKYDVFAKLDRFSLCKNKTVNNLLLFLGGCVLLVIGVYFYTALPLEIFWEYHYALFPVLVICFCRKYIITIPVLSQILRYLGKHSMNIFLTHLCLRNVFFLDFIHSFRYFILTPAILLLLSLAVSVLLIEPIKKLVRYDAVMQKLTTALLGAQG